MRVDECPQCGQVSVSSMTVVDMRLKVLSIPGSNLHQIRALRHPRWEDFNYERMDRSSNRLFWLGDGMSYNEKTMTGDRKSMFPTDMT